MDFKRNIIITGGAGFIGSHVVRLFVNKYPEYRIINVDKLTYAGNLAVGGFEKSVVVDVKIDQVAGSLDLVLNDVKFAANMPLTLDITLKEIPYLVNDGALNFSATNVAPCINAENEPVAAYTFASVNGVIEGDRLLLDAKMAEDLAAYVAGMEFTFEGTEIDK